MPGKRLRIVLDTDAFNEIDGQFVIAYLRRLAPILSTEAIYAAPFLNERSSSHEDGMLKSYDEITVVATRSATPGGRRANKRWGVAAPAMWDC